MVVGLRRSNIDIIADMLKIGENGAGKTRLMYHANLSYTQIQKYLSFLVNQGLVNKVQLSSPPITYQVTESGHKLLKLITNIQELLETEDKQIS